jgi:hypothetical protein
MTAVLNLSFSSEERFLVAAIGVVVVVLSRR